jgi:ubiquitin carboxyl-terminal hydrolase L3
MATENPPDPAPFAEAAGEKQKRIAFIPLEANPQLMTELLHRLGVSSALQMHDVLSLTDPDLLAFIPRPALAVLMVFPVSAAHTSHRLAEDSLREDYKASGPGEPVVWFRQTIRNACGMMGLLHATANGPARGFVGTYTAASRRAGDTCLTVSRGQHGARQALCRRRAAWARGAQPAC